MPVMVALMGLSSPDGSTSGDLGRDHRQHEQSDQTGAKQYSFNQSQRFIYLQLKYIFMTSNHKHTYKKDS
jgi:hypothetical protein